MNYSFENRYFWWWMKNWQMRLEILSRYNWEDNYETKYLCNQDLENWLSGKNKEHLLDSKDTIIYPHDYNYMGREEYEPSYFD